MGEMPKVTSLNPIRIFYVHFSLSLVYHICWSTCVCVHFITLPSKYWKRIEITWGVGESTTSQRKCILDTSLSILICATAYGGSGGMTRVSFITLLHSLSGTRQSLLRKFQYVPGNILREIISLLLFASMAASPLDSRHFRVEFSKKLKEILKMMIRNWISFLCWALRGAKSQLTSYSYK